MEESQTFNIDNMVGMANYPDKFFDIAIVDPPYGIGQNWKKDKTNKFYDHENDFNNHVPSKQYFDELFRVSKHQIIWGANYYWNYLRPSNNLIFWDKKKDAEKQFGSSGELAWTSFTKFPLIKIELAWSGFHVCENTVKIHPHQKPIKLYDWCFDKFSKKGDKILDTHLGSGSSRIAAKKHGLYFVGFEKDKHYFELQEERWMNYNKQLKIQFTGINF